MSKKTIVNLFTGFLGVGKTTALRHLIQTRPSTEKWAVIVNEFGEVGIDGAALLNDDLPVAEIAGGCMCCVAGPQMTATVATLLRREKPDRLLIEASGLAHAAGVIDELREKPLGDALEVGAVLTLVDPRQFVNPDYMRQPLYRDQVAIADVLIGNKADMADVEMLAQFQQQAEGLFPPKSLIKTVINGEVDVDWMNAPVVTKPRYRPAVPHDASSAWTSMGWTFPPEQDFDGEALIDFFDALPKKVDGLVRAKGVFKVLGSWVWLNWAEGQWGATQVSWRRDSRFELIASQIDAEAVEAELKACFEA